MMLSKLLILLVGAAQPTFAVTLAAVLFTYHGERTPVLTSDSFVPTYNLTTLGANQMFKAGSYVRSRYISGNNSTRTAIIAGIDPSTIDNAITTVLTRDETYISSGALAFMQGLYPPTTEGASQETLGNGQKVVAPLNGYQYPDVHTLSSLDLNRIWLAGNLGCPNYFTAYAALHDDVESNVAKQQAVDVLAESLREDSPDLAPEVFAEATAKEIYEYALYKYNHDSRYQKSLAPNSTTMSQLRALASEQAFYSNQSASPAITELATLPGRTLAAFVVGQFQSLIVAAKQLSPQFPQHKLTLLFGSSAPIIDFFMLSQLSSSSLTSRQFSSLPERGSVMGFELFTPDQPNGTVLPESFTPRNLLVRFVWRNGTDEDAPMRAYPLFGRGNSQTEIPWTDFVSSIETFSMTRVQRWCRICDSMSVFCKAITAQSSTLGGASSSPSGGLSNALAGLIGAIVTLAVLAITLLLLGILGFRLHRERSDKSRPPTHRSDRSSRSHWPAMLQRHSSGAPRGGFKGSEKLASDLDLASAGAANECSRTRGTGHSSWELGEGADGFTGRVVDGARSSHANDGEMDDFEALGKAHEVEERV